MKKIIYWLAILPSSMVILPYIDVLLVPNNAGMIITIVLLFVVNSLYSIAADRSTGKNIKTLWRFMFFFWRRQTVIATISCF